MQLLWRTVWKFLKRLKTELPYDPATSLLDIYLEKTVIWKDICSPMFITSLFTIPKTWKQPKCPSTVKWVKKMCVCVCVCVCVWILLSYKKMKEYHLQQHGWTWRFHSAATATAAKSHQSCPTLCDPIDGSPPGSPVPGILQARYWSGLPLPSSMHESEKWKWSHSVMSDS